MPYVFNPFTGSFDDTVPLSGGKISSEYLPSYVDDIIEVANFAALPGTGETGKIYITLDDNNTYRWSGSQYVLVGPEPPVVSVNGETGAVSLDLDKLTDTDLEAEHIAPFDDGRALIYVNGKWQVGPVVGGYQYNTGNDPLAANVVYGNSYDTTLLDETGYWDQITKVLTVTQVGASPPVVQTTTKKYGLGSLQCDGTASYIQYTTTTNASDLNFDAGDFCIEFWARDTRGSGARGLFYYSSSSSFHFVINASGYLSVGSGLGIGSNQVWPGGWVHVALTREDGLFRLFQNGVLVGSQTISRTYNSYPTIRVGYANPAAPYYWTGQIDDLRITKGAARYTANFTAPTGAILGENVIGSYSIDNLDDVDTTTAAPTNGQALAWDGSNFVPTTVVRPTDSVNVLADVDTTTVAPTNGQLLTWDAADSRWEPGNTTLKALEDTYLDIDPAPGASLIWNGGKWVEGPSVGGVQTYTDANLIIPFNDTVNPTQGSLYDNGVTTAISSSITFSTTTKQVGSGSAFFNNAGGVAINNSTLFNFFRQNSWTLEVWLYPVTLNTNWIFGFVNSNGSPQNIQLKVTNTRQLSVISGSNTIISASTNTEMSANAWNHVALVYNYSANQITMYLNGISKGTGTTGTWDLGYTVFSIGSLYSSTYNNWFNIWGTGYMDNIVLTPGLKYTGTFTPSTSEEGAFVPERYIPSDVTGITGASTITNIVQLSQANYDAIVTPNANTLYVIV